MPSGPLAFYRRYMAETKREIERKYESDDSGLPDLTGVAGIATVLDKGVVDLDAVYYDTADERLAADSLTLRRRTGGSDAGWHLKFPVAPGVRDELRAPLSDMVPRDLARLVRSRVRNGELRPLVRLLSSRDVRELLDAEGELIAEASVDAVRAERLGGPGAGRVAQWAEMEVELAEGRDPELLDAIEERLREAGVRPARSASKLARALSETAPENEAARKEAATNRAATNRAKKKSEDEAVSTAGDHVLAYVRTQRDAVVTLDPAVRRNLPDSVHQMRVATRRLRSALRSYPKVLDRSVTDPVGAELKWLAGELGVGRDQEVLAEHLSTALGKLPKSLVGGPVRARMRTWARARHADSRGRMITALDSRRYLRLLDTLDALLADPPLLPAAAKKPAKVLGKAVDKELGRLSGLVDKAIGLPSGKERDLALHEARKKAKRVRYAAEAATGALGRPAKDLVSSAKSVQTLLGDHQDSVMAREALRDIAAQAHAAGEDSFTYGVLYGREEKQAAEAEDALPGVWEAVVTSVR